MGILSLNDCLEITLKILNKITNLQLKIMKQSIKCLNITGLVFKENPKSKLKILQPPIWECEPLKDEDGKVIWNPPSEKVNNLYVIGIDSIDIGAQDTSSSTKNPSDFCVTVKKRAYGLQEPEYVCIYKDRPEDIREAYKIAIKIAQWYNAVINIEATRMNMISWARDHHYLKFFMKPLFVILFQMIFQKKEKKKF